MDQGTQAEIHSKRQRERERDKGETREARGNGAEAISVTLMALSRRLTVSGVYWTATDCSACLSSCRQHVLSPASPMAAITASRTLMLSHECVCVCVCVCSYSLTHSLTRFCSVLSPVHVPSAILVLVTDVLSWSPWEYVCACVRERKPVSMCVSA